MIEYEFYCFSVDQSESSYWSGCRQKQNLTDFFFWFCRAIYDLSKKCRSKGLTCPVSKYMVTLQNMQKNMGVKRDLVTPVARLYI